MPKIKLVNIGILQPTQTELNEEYILELKENKTHKPIEVIEVQGNVYISDGHHALFVQQKKNNSQKIATNYDDFDKAKPAYREQNQKRIDEILQNAQNTQNNGITHIMQLALI